MFTLETLYSDGKKVISNVAVNNNTSAGIVIRGSNVYSSLLDECVQFSKMEVKSDGRRITYTFYLCDPMYTMASVHNIGLKNFKDAVLVIKSRKREDL